MLSALEIKTSFIRKDDILNVLYKYKTQLDMDLAICENQKEKNKMAKAYRQKIFTKLNTIFRRQVVLDGEEAIKFYSENDDVLNDRVDIFFTIIEYINDDLSIEFIPDRLMACGFFRIDAETYAVILNDPRADISQNLKTQIRNIEEFIISMTTNGLEQGSITSFAWKKMQLKSEFGGNEIKTVDSNIIKPSAVVITSGAEVEKRLSTNYNFPELLEDNKKDDN